MTFIRTVPEPEAEGETAAIYAEVRGSMGYLPNFVPLFSERPEVFRAWQQLNGALKTRDLRRYELATVAAAKALRSSYCALSHGKVLAEQFLGPDAVADLPAGLDDVDLAVVALAEKVVRDASSVTQTDVDGLRELGLDDAEIVDVVLAAAARCFFSKAVDALGALPDGAFMGLDPALRESLTVGRPIEPRGA
jgi:uncharacterized peroxidase-related enzyme